MNDRLRDRVIALIESHSPYGYREFLEALRADIIEVAQWRQERDQLRAQRDALLAAAEKVSAVIDKVLDNRSTVNWSDLLRPVDQLQKAVRNCKETNQ